MAWFEEQLQNSPLSMLQTIHTDFLLGRLVFNCRYGTQRKSTVRGPMAGLVGASIGLIPTGHSTWNLNISK
jgi:hypothetical protein